MAKSLSLPQLTLIYTGDVATDEITMKNLKQEEIFMR